MPKKIHFFLAQSKNILYLCSRKAALKLDWKGKTTKRQKKIKSISKVLSIISRSLHLIQSMETSFVGLLFFDTS